MAPFAAPNPLPLLAAELGFSHPIRHRARNDAITTRQLLLRLREAAAALDEGLKEAVLALVAPYGWALARFFAEALTASNPETAKTQVAGCRSDSPRQVPTQASDGPHDITANAAPQ